MGSGIVKQGQEMNKVHTFDEIEFRSSEFWEEKESA